MTPPAPGAGYRAIWAQWWITAGRSGCTLRVATQVQRSPAGAQLRHGASGGHVRRRRSQNQSSLRGLDVGEGVHEAHSSELLNEVGFELAHVFVVGPELGG